jgi:hypothetical protein
LSTPFLACLCGFASGRKKAGNRSPLKEVEGPIASQRSPNSTNQARPAHPFYWLQIFLEFQPSPLSPRISDAHVKHESSASPLSLLSPLFCLLYFLSNWRK